MNLAGTQAAHLAEPKPRARHAGRRLVETCLRRLLGRVDRQLCPPGQLPKHGIHRVLVLRPNHRLGNAVLVSALLDEIETRYPGAEVDVLGAGHAARMLFASRFQVRRVFCLERRIVRHLPATFACLRALRATHYDLVINPCVASNSAHLLLGVCKARYKVGFAASRTVDMLRAHDPNMPEHMAKRGVHALRLARGDAPSATWPALDVRLSSSEMQQAHNALEHILGGVKHANIRGPVLGVFANATGNKRLPEVWWSDLVAELQERHPGLRIVNVLAEHGHSQLPDSTFPFYTRDLRKLAAMVANMDGFVCGDCGVMHLAAAVGTPTLGLFVRANRAKYTPYGGRNDGLDVAMDAASDDDSTTRAAVIAWVTRAVVSGGNSPTQAIDPDDATGPRQRRPVRHRSRF